jgi:hypothetical protein
MSTLVTAVRTPTGTKCSVLILSRVKSVTIDGVWIGDGFIDHLCTPLGTTGNYRAIADLYT